jgi:SAM-dependent methyltransferase
MLKINYDKIISEEIEKHKDSPVDMLTIGDITSEYRYLKSHQDSYVRTIRDVDNLFKHSDREIRILEIGSMLGVVSISLKKRGYHVYACDIPEFYNSVSLRNLYETNDIPFSGFNLKYAKLPYNSNFFDLVIICEVIEHLNFNPLPLLSDISRVLKNDGYLYISMPNQSNIGNRIMLATGKSIHNPIDDFFRQLDRKSNMVVALHWREYTLSETLLMIEKMGFKAILKYYFAEKDKTGSSFLMFLKWLIKRVLYAYPPFRPCQVVIGQKVTTPVNDFWLTEANS